MSANGEQLAWGCRSLVEDANEDAGFAALLSPGTESIGDPMDVYDFGV